VGGWLVGQPGEGGLRVLGVWVCGVVGCQGGIWGGGRGLGDARCARGGWVSGGWG